MLLAGAVGERCGNTRANGVLPTHVLRRTEGEMKGMKGEATYLMTRKRWDVLFEYHVQSPVAQQASVCRMRYQVLIHTARRFRLGKYIPECRRHTQYVSSL
jgi:hypothetical protein